MALNTDFELFPLIASRKKNDLLKKLVEKQLGDINLEKKLKDAEKYDEIDDLFWLSLYYYNINSELSNKIKIKKFIFDHRSGEGGFFETNSNQPDVITTYKCLTILHFMKEELNIDEKKMTILFLKSMINKNGLARHCNNKKCSCSNKSSIEYSYYLISSLILLDSLQVIEKEIESLTSADFYYSEDKIVYRLFINQFLYSKKKLNRRKLIKKFQRKTDISQGKIWKDPKIIEETIKIFHFLGLNNSLEDINTGKLYSQSIKPILLDMIQKVENKTEFSIAYLFKLLILLFILLNNLYDELEARIFKEFSRSRFIRLEPIVSQFDIEQELLINIMNLLQEKYKWFNIRKVLYEDLFAKFANNFKQPEKSVIKKLKDLIIIQKQAVIEFGGIEKENKISTTKLREILSTLIDYGLLFGKLQSKSMKILATPESFYLLKKKIPLREILHEMSELGLLNLKILETIQEFQEYPANFSNSIEYLLNIDEFELAESKKSNNIKNYYLLLNGKTESIQNNLKAFKYFSVADLDHYSELLETTENIKVKLEETEKKLSSDIKKQEKIITAYSEIANFIDSFTEDQITLKKKLDEVFTSFFQACKDKKIDKKKSKFLKEIDLMQEQFKSIISKLKENKKYFINLTSKIKLFNNFIIIEDKKFDSSHSLAPELKSGNPFDWWIKNYWDAKKSDFLKRINEFQSYFYKREQIMEELDSNKISFKNKYENLLKISDPEKKMDNLLIIYDDILNIDKYLKEFISDTAQVLENFPEVVNDILIQWKSFKDDFYKLLHPIKEDIEVLILSSQKIKTKLDIEKKIDDKINEFEKKLNELDKLGKKDWIKSKKPLLVIFNEKIREHYEELKEFNGDLNKLYKKNIAHYENIKQFLNISMNKWKDYFVSIEEIYKERRIRLLKMVIYSIISNKSVMEGGRIKLDFISKKLDLNKRTLKTILERSKELFSVDIIFTKDDEILPLFNFNEKLWDFENFLISSNQEFSTKNQAMINAFLKIVKKKTIILNEEEILSKIESNKKRLTEIISESDQKGKNFIKMNHLIDILNEYNKNKELFLNNVKKIESIFSERNNIEAYFDEFLDNINKKFEKLKKLKEIKQRDEILDLYDEIDFLIGTLEFERSSPTNQDKFKEKIEDFGPYLSDLKDETDKKFNELIDSIKNFQQTSNKKFKELLEGICLCDINQRISEYRVQFKETLNEVDGIIRSQSGKNDTKLSKTELKKYNKILVNNIDESNKKLLKFIEFVESDRGLRFFRHDSKFILQDWNVDEMKEGIDIYLKIF